MVEPVIEVINEGPDSPKQDTEYLLPCCFVHRSIYLTTLEVADVGCAIVDYLLILRLRAKLSADF
jgi:hypothetical protein